MPRMGRKTADQRPVLPDVRVAELRGTNVAGAELLLGDIILARGVCEAEAAEKGVTVEDHATHLIVHGTLHLLGYDHHGDERPMIWKRGRSVRSTGWALPILTRYRLMATRNDEQGGSRLWRGCVT